MISKMEQLQNKNIKELSRFLTEKGIRPSQMRITLLMYLKNHPTHPTIDEMYVALRDGHPTLSKTTIYNTMDLFVSQGVVNSINIDEKNLRYDAFTDLHAHFICNCCGAISDIKINNKLADLLKENAPKNSTLGNTDVYYKGICNKCKNKNLLTNKNLKQ